MGDKHRISKDFNDPTFQKLLHDMDRNRVPCELSSFYVRPAYAHTKQSIGGVTSCRTRRTMK